MPDCEFYDCNEYKDWCNKFDILDCEKCKYKNLKEKNMSNDASKLYNERMKNPAFKAAYNAFSEGLSRGFQLQEMAFYMFLEGIKYEKNRVKSSQN